MDKAGAIVVSRSKPHAIALIRRAHKSDWSFLKGRAKKGESPAETMRREVYEESGLAVEIVRPLPEHVYGHILHGPIICRFFLTRALVDSVIRPEKPGDMAVWFPPEDVEEKLAHSTMTNYWRRVRPGVLAFIETL